MAHDQHHHPGRRSSDKHPIRSFVDSRAFWSGLAFVVVAGLFIFTVVTYSQEQSDRASRHASAQAEYQQCLGSIPLLVKVNKFVVGVRTVGQVLLANSIRMHVATKPTDGTAHLYLIQEQNIRRLRRAIAPQKDLTFPVPTLATCRALLAHPRG